MYRYYNKQSSRDTSARLPLPNYQYLRDRISSFRDIITKSFTVSCLKLSEAGYYYTKVGMEVRCFACNSTHDVHSFGSKDEVFSIHRSCAPDCPFLLGKVRSIPLSQIPVAEDQCPTCGKSLLREIMPRSQRDLLPNRVINRDTSPNVDHESQCYRDAFGMDTLEIPNNAQIVPEPAKYLQEVTSVDVADFDKPVRRLGMKLHSKPPKRTKSNHAQTGVCCTPLSQEKLQKYMDTNITKAVLQLGFHKEVIESVIRNRIYELSEFFPNFESLYEAVLDYQDELAVRDGEERMENDHVDYDIDTDYSVDNGDVERPTVDQERRKCNNETDEGDV